MEQTKGFFDVFRRYAPTPDKRALLEKGRDCAIRYVRGDQKRVEVQLTFDEPVDQDKLYRIEQDCLTFYGLISFRIFPHYPPQTFSCDRMPDIAVEAVHVGAATPGFFDRAHYSDDGTTVTVEIPFLASGVDVVKGADTERLLAGIIFSRFGIQRKVSVVQSSDAEEQTARRMEAVHKMEAEYDRKAMEAAARGAAAHEREQKVTVEPEAPALPRVSGLTDSRLHYVMRDATTFECGDFIYETDSPSMVMGDPFTISEPTAIGLISNAKTNAVVLGTVFSVQTKENRSGDRVTVHIGMTDGASSIFIKATGAPDEIDWYKSVGVGEHLAVQGRIVIDRFDGELVLQARAIAKIDRTERMDTAPEKRVELHLHTVMSTMDALIRPDELLACAERWGHKAVAITDHGNVQTFPEILKAKRSAKSSVKILYGMEAYFVNDDARAIFGQNLPGFDDEMVVFDLETTGLSAKRDRIIEIGAVRIKGGEVLDSFDMFVNPGMPIPQKITELTSITDEMVADAPDISVVLPQFLAYAGGRMLIAHNANFDVGFVRAAAEELGIPFTPTYLDTFALSRYVNPELSKHKLDIIAEHYGLGDFHHHRASDDATMLALIFFKMQERLRAEGVLDFSALNEAMSEKADPLKLKTYHMILFARNQTGLKNLYKLVSESYLTYYKRFPRIPKSLLERYRDGLLVGSACEAGELYRALLDNMGEADIEEIASFYDYLEIQPLCNNMFLVDEQKVADEEALRDINRRILALGKKLGKPVVATCDAHFLRKDEEQLRKILLRGLKMSDGDRDTGNYFRTTDEMLDEFA